MGATSVSLVADLESFAARSSKMDAGYLESVESCQRDMGCALVDITLGYEISNVSEGARM